MNKPLQREYNERERERDVLGRVGIVGGDLVSEHLGILVEQRMHAEDVVGVVADAHRNAGTLSAADLDLGGKDLGVVVAQAQCRHGHHLRNGAEGKVLRVLDLVQVLCACARASTTPGFE